MRVGKRHTHTPHPPPPKEGDICYPEIASQQGLGTRREAGEVKCLAQGNRTSKQQSPESRQWESPDKLFPVSIPLKPAETRQVRQVRKGARTQTQAF